MLQNLSIVHVKGIARVHAVEVVQRHVIMHVITVVKEDVKVLVVVPVADPAILANYPV